MYLEEIHLLIIVVIVFLNIRNQMRFKMIVAILNIDKNVKELGDVLGNL